ncbi:MAG: MerR family DNA-binding transcriptional regulator [Defluviitaleaceae bacterium]|nr:MerR family DNA-binding transcriptional regulator [Defluviitaleaceae bacterium]MCL2263242.1 MerR family DNA-binding transcriptional regulator [Defluviitaleaceae bacterium]
MKKNNLLSIGDVSKLTGAGIKALRYYEQINILKPAYVSPESGYRYYTFDQLFLVSMIMFCVELDIPLAKMTRFIEEDGALDLRGFINEGRAVAEKKMTAIKKGLKNIADVEQQINLTEQHKPGEIYTREIPERKFYVIPGGSSITNIDHIEMFKSFSSLPYWDDESWLGETDEISEYGILREYTGTENMYYYFVKIPIGVEAENVKTIKGGTYICTQTESFNRKIEKADEIFGLQAGKPFIAIETEIIAGRHNANEPLWELRAI